MSKQTPEVIPFLKLENGQRGSPLGTLNNYRAVFQAHNIKIAYDMIAKEMRISIPGREYLSDNSINCGLAELINIATAHKLPTGHLRQYLFALSDENRFNPVTDWIESKAWDGTERLEQFYATISGTNENLKNTLLKRWMISAVAAAYESNGIAASGILVLQGPQYVGKTNWFKHLVSEEKRHLIKDGMSIDTQNKDSLFYCLSHWLVELGEIATTFRRSEMEALKAFVTADRDIIRLPYAAAASSFPRRTVFFGSVNESLFLRDVTGHRRFWTVECTAIDHSHALDMQQVWAEVAVLYHDREQWNLTRDEFADLEAANKDYEVTDPMEERLQKKYNWDGPILEWKTATEILDELGYKNPGRAEATSCGILVAKLNGGQKKKSGGRRLLGVPWPL